MRRSYHLENSNHGKELLDLITSPDKKIFGFSVHTIPDSKRIQNFPPWSGEQIQKVADSYAAFTRYVWTEAVPRKERDADSKISGYVWKEPKSTNCSLCKELTKVRR